MTGSEQDLVLTLFEEKADGWSAKYGPDGALAGRLVQFPQAVTARVPVGSKVLDLGCGSGELARHLAAAGYRVVGCDISPRMLRRAAAGADDGGPATWLRLDSRWQALPFAPASLDAVVAASVFEYVQHPAAVLSECARVLRPGGVLLCTVPDVVHPVRWLEWPLAGAARLTPAGFLAGHGLRLASYLAYLKTSRHRRTARWWDATAARAGLRPEPEPLAAPKTGPRTPLRLLSFTRERS